MAEQSKTPATAAPQQPAPQAAEPNKPHTGNFKVSANHLAFGPFPTNHVFSLDEFKRIHDVPKGADADAYHQSLIQRGIDLGAIVHTTEKVSESTPIGPEFSGTYRNEKPDTQTGKAGHGANEGVKPDVAGRRQA